MRWYFGLLLLFSSTTWAAEDKPLWEYGVGFGYVRFEQYPAADQYSNVALPFPTFQYRGETLRADDREGARTFLFKQGPWSVELSGSGFPPLDSEANRARTGMEDVPLMFNLGPRLVYNPSDKNWEVKAGLFQAHLVDGIFIQKNGVIFDADLIYHFDFGHSRGRISAGVKIASQELQASYFDVRPIDASVDRPAYAAKGGFLNSEASYFHSYSAGKFSLYLGFGVRDYANSVNRSSPLHKSNFNVSYLAGFTYMLGESERRSVPVEQTRGLINKYKARQLRILPFE